MLYYMSHGVWRVKNAYKESPLGRGKEWLLKYIKCPKLKGIKHSKSDTSKLATHDDFYVFFTDLTFSIAQVL